MIRKYLLWFIVWFVWLLSFSYWIDNSSSLPWSFYFWSINNIIWNDLNLSNSNWGDWWYDTGYSCKRSIFWSSWKLYFYGYCPNDSFSQWFFSKACKVYSSWGDLVLPVCGNDSDFTVANLNEFYLLTWYNFTRYYTVWMWDYYGMQLCVYNSNNQYYYCFSRQTLDNSLGIVSWESDYSQYAWQSPFSDWFDVDIWNWWIELWSDYSAINYYEKTYWWDSSICYAWVDNLTSLYWQSSVSFQEGGWLSIFQVFSWLYSWDQDLTHMYVWLNSLLWNYELWYAIWSPTLTEVWNPPYLLNYNSWSYQVDVYYVDLVFPFAWKPVALYYLASNIESQSVYNTMWSSVVSYCNIKINWWSYDDIVSLADKNNITNYTEQSNINHWLNPDWTDIEHDWYFWSWVSIAFSGDTSIKNTLKNFFDAFDSWLSIIDVNTNNRILPTWLVSAFIFVVLFKFLRKR